MSLCVHVCLMCVCAAKYYLVMKTQRFDNWPEVPRLSWTQEFQHGQFDFRAHTLSPVISLPADGVPISFFNVYFTFITTGPQLYTIMKLFEIHTMKCWDST